MKFLSLLCGLSSLLLCVGCSSHTLTLDQTNDIQVPQPVATGSLSEKASPQPTISSSHDDILYIYLRSKGNLPESESVTDCYRLEGETVTADEVTQGLYSGIEATLDPSQRVYYAVREMHNERCRGGKLDPETSPTIGWYLVVGNDIYQASEPGGVEYSLIANDIQSF